MFGSSIDLMVSAISVGPSIKIAGRTSLGGIDLSSRSICAAKGVWNLRAYNWSKCSAFSKRRCKSGRPTNAFFPVTRNSFRSSWASKATSDVALLAQELRNEFLVTGKKALVGRPDLQRLLEKAEHFDQLYALRFHTPFAAQMLREDKSIPPSEVLPAILMEGPTEIAETIKSIDDPNIQIQFQREAIRLLQAAKAEGAHIENLESILKALEVSTN